MNIELTINTRQMIGTTSPLMLESLASGHLAARTLLPPKEAFPTSTSVLLGNPDGKLKAFHTTSGAMGKVS